MARKKAIKTVKSSLQRKNEMQTKQPVKATKGKTAVSSMKKSSAKVVSIPVDKNPKRLESISIGQRLNLSESYMSLVLGVIVVLIIGMLGIGFIKATKRGALMSLFAPKSVQKSVSSTNTLTDQPDPHKPTEKPTPGYNYIVKDGEYLYDIATRAYGNGDRFTDIVKANNLQTPDDIPPGTTLKIPR